MAEYGESSYRRFLRHDPQALEELIRTYSDALIRYAYCYVKDTATAEDMMEETFVAVFLRGRRLHEDQLRPYLYKTLRNKCIDHLRKYRAEVPLCDVENVLVGGNVEQDAMRLHRNKTVYAAMQQLPDQYREVLELAYFDGFSVEEICGILGKRPKQIYNLLARAKIALRKILEREDITHEDL